MSKRDKLINRFKSIPSDFTFDELSTLLRREGYRQLEGTGSRVGFYKEQTNHMIKVHKPHPGSICKKYALRETLQRLEEAGEI